jgi:hypothetical protein
MARPTRAATQSHRLARYVVALEQDEFDPYERATLELGARYERAVLERIDVVQPGCSQPGS